MIHADPQCQEITLAVLAGGQGSRMGQAKGDLRLDALPILQRLHQRLAWRGPTLLITAPGRAHPPGWECFDAEATDPTAGQGPLRGVLTALETATSAAIVIIPVDMPELTAAPLAHLVDHLRAYPQAIAVMFERAEDPRSDRQSDACGGAALSDRKVMRTEPLPAAFAVAGARPLVRRRIESGQLALRGLAGLPQAITITADVPHQFWTNLNHPEELAAWQQRSSLRD